MSIRARLALGAAAAVAIAIVLASVVVYFLVRNELRAQVDRNLQSEAHSIAQFPLSYSTYAYPPNVYSFDVPSSLFTGYFQLVGDDGRIYLPAGYLSPSPLLPVNAACSGGRRGQEQRLLLRQAAPGSGHARVHDVLGSLPARRDPGRRPALDDRQRARPDPPLAAARLGRGHRSRLGCRPARGPNDAPALSES